MKSLLKRIGVILPRSSIPDTHGQYLRYHSRYSLKKALSISGLLVIVLFAVGLVAENPVDVARPSPHPVIGKVFRSDGAMPAKNELLRVSARVAAKESDKLGRISNLEHG